MPRETCSLLGGTALLGRRDYMTDIPHGFHADLKPSAAAKPKNHSRTYGRPIEKVFGPWLLVPCESHIFCAEHIRQGPRRSCAQSTSDWVFKCSCFALRLLFHMHFCLFLAILPVSSRPFHCPGCICFVLCVFPVKRCYFLAMVPLSCYLGNS